jgi:uncharacterized protein involved in exopolysaccharide biosynthesis
LNLYALANAILRHRFLIATVVLAATVITVLLQLKRDRIYASTGSFVSQGGGTPMTGAAGLAAQLGLSLGGAGMSSTSPQFYADLAKTRGIMGKVVANRYAYRTDTGMVEGTLVRVLGVKGANDAERRDRAISSLDRMLSVDVSARTGIVKVTARATHPELAFQIASNVLTELARFNLETRQSQAAAERRFTEQRLASARHELQAAEGREAAFLARNRQYHDSPILTAEFGRLNREVESKSQVYTTLAQAYEQSKIEEVRDTPVLTPVDPPETPVRSEAMGRIKNVLFAMLVATALAVLFAFVWEYFRRSSRENETVAAEFRALRLAAADDLRHPLRAVKSRLKGERPAPLS